MKTQLAMLALLTTLYGCGDANDVSGPGLPKKTPPRGVPDPEARAHPVVVSNPRGSEVAPARPYSTPTPRAYPCLVDPTNMEKNEPCRPCDDITVAPGVEPKNKPCHVYGTPTPRPRGPRNP